MPADRTPKATEHAQDKVADDPEAALERVEDPDDLRPLAWETRGSSPGYTRLGN